MRRELKAKRGRKPFRIALSLLVSEMLLQRASALDGIHQILLSVAATQGAALRLYRSVGFTSYGCEPSALKIGERFIDEEYMALRVR